MKVVLIALDTLRADHMGCYGYHRDTSPVMDRLSEDSLFFENAISPISYTLPSIMSVMTSLYPSFHSQQFLNTGSTLMMNSETLPGVLQKHSDNIKTAAFVSTIVLSAASTPVSGLFDVYDDNFTYHELNRPTELLRTGKQTTDKALRWIGDNCNNDFFVFLHYMDIHGPYVPPFWYKRRYIKDSLWSKHPVSLDAIETMSIYGSVDDGYKPGIPDYQLLNAKRDDKGKLIGYEKNADYYISQYDSNIRYVDNQIERIMSLLKKKGIYDDTLLVIFSDHGEAFGENGVYFFHGLTVTMEQVHVPLIVKLPGNERGRSTEPVSLLDIMPTILDFYGIRQGGLQGASLLDTSADRIIFSQILKQLSVINSHGQLLIGNGWFESQSESDIFKSTFGSFKDGNIDNRDTSYLHRGPGEPDNNRGNLYRSAEEFVNDANVAAERHLGELPAGQQDTDEDIKDKLRALGYI